MTKMIKSLKFNGLDNYVKIDDSETPKKFTDKLTVEAWVKLDKKQEWTGFASFMEDNAQTEKGWMLGITYGEYTFGLCTDDNTGRITYLRAENFNIKTGLWVHLAGVYDGKEMKLYVDGELKCHEAKTGDISYPQTGELVIGAVKDDDELYPFAGNIAEVRLWNDARLKQLIKEFKDKKLTTLSDELAGYWPIVDGSGIAVQSSLADGKQGDIRSESGNIVWDSYKQDDFPIPDYAASFNPPRDLNNINIKSDGFTAEWERIEMADGYILCVKDDPKEIPEQVEREIEVQQTNADRVQQKVDGLESGKEYFWSVKSTKGDETSGESGIKYIITRSFSIPDANHAVFLGDTGQKNFGYVKMENPAQFPTDKITVEAWVKPDNLKDSVYIGISDDQGGLAGWSIGAKNGMFYFSLSDKTDVRVDSGRPINCKAWQHIAAVYDGGRMEIYVNGEIQGAKNISAAINYPENSAIRFGGTLVENNKAFIAFTGMMSDVRIWKSALADAAVRNRMYYRIDNPWEVKELVSYFPLTEGRDDKVFDVAGSRRAELKEYDDLNKAWQDAGRLCLFWSMDEIKQITAGKNHTLALKHDGTVWAWGGNHRGQLGDGTYSDRVSPVMVKDGDGEKYLANILQIAVGDNHSLALDNNKNVWVWGDNTSNQSGQENLKETDENLLPVKVPNVSNIEKICAASDFSLALNNNKEILAWGDNSKNQMGNDEYKIEAEEVEKYDGDALNGIIEITAGKYHGTALDGKGKVWGWGEIEDIPIWYKELKNAVILKDKYGHELEGIKQIASGSDHTLALDDKGQVWTWGDNKYNQLGRDGGSNSLPARVRTVDGDWLTGVEQIFAGYYSSFAKTKTGLLAWGMDHNMPEGEDSVSGLPRQIQNAESVACGEKHTVVLASDGTVNAWGKNNHGQLGNGKKDAKSDDIINFAGGYRNAFAVKKDGTAWGWGAKSDILGLKLSNDQLSQLKPARISGIGGVGQLENVRSIATTVYGFSQGGNEELVCLAVLNNGCVCAWGKNGSGQCGLGHTKSPQEAGYIDFDEKVSQVACGDGFAIALTENGEIFTWGENFAGQLGIGNENEFSTPQKSTATEGTVTAITTGSYFCLALKKDGTVLSWGKNGHGELGQGHKDDINTPTLIPDFQDIVAISAGDTHSMALDIDGDVWTWGNNDCGQLGLGDTNDRHKPVKVESRYKIVAISAGTKHSLALDEYGSVWAWGENDHGRLGYYVKGNVNQTKPQRVVLAKDGPPLSGIVAIRGAHQNSYALDEEGNLRAWGANSYGECGDGGGGGDKKPRNYPVKVKYND